jgi:hypothetical protein
MEEESLLVLLANSAHKFSTLKQCCGLVKGHKEEEIVAYN